MDHESLQYCPYAAGTRGLVISLCRWATDWPPAIIYHPGIKTPSWVEVFWPLRHDGAVTQSAPVSFFAASQITAVCLTAARSGLPACQLKSRESHHGTDRKARHNLHGLYRGQKLRGVSVSRRNNCYWPISKRRMNHRVVNTTNAIYSSCVNVK